MQINVSLIKYRCFATLLFATLIELIKKMIKNFTFLLPIVLAVFGAGGWFLRLVQNQEKTLLCICVPIYFSYFFFNTRDRNFWKFYYFEADNGLFIVKETKSKMSKVRIFDSARLGLFFCLIKGSPKRKKTTSKSCKTTFLYYGLIWKSKHVKFENLQLS